MDEWPYSGLECAPDTESVTTREIEGFMSRCRLVTVLMVLFVTSSVFSSLSGANAFAVAKSKVTVATGGVTCRRLTGSITLSPPLQKGGVKPETMLWKIHVSDCTTTKSNVKHLVGVNMVSTVDRPNNACGGVVYSKSVSPSFAWIPKSVHSTSASFSGFSFLKNKAGREGFTLPNAGGTASVSGSFAGSDHGKRSVITLYTNLTIAAFTAACESKTGLAGYRIVSGSATLS